MREPGALCDTYIDDLHFRNLSPIPSLRTMPIQRKSAVAVRQESEIHSPARRWTRIKLDVPIRVIYNRNSEATLINARGRELSDGGMAVFAGVELKSGQKIDIEFTPAYGLPIRVHGLVRNQTGYFYGIEFAITCPEQEVEVARLRATLRSSAGFGT